MRLQSHQRNFFYRQILLDLEKVSSTLSLSLSLTLFFFFFFPDLNCLPDLNTVPQQSIACCFSTLGSKLLANVLSAFNMEEENSNKRTNKQNNNFAVKLGLNWTEHYTDSNLARTRLSSAYQTNRNISSTSSACAGPRTEGSLRENLSS